MAEGKLFYSIGEAAALVGVEEYVLRFWEKNFPAVKPARKAGRRYFRQRDIDVLLRIKDLLYRQGFTIKGAKKAMAEKRVGRDLGIEDSSADAGAGSEPVVAGPPPKRQRVLARFSTNINPVAPSADAADTAPSPIIPSSAIPKLTLEKIVKKIEAIEDMLK